MWISQTHKNLDIFRMEQFFLQIKKIINYTLRTIFMVKNCSVAKVTFKKELLIIYLLNMHQRNTRGTPGALLVITYINASHALIKQKK